MLDLGGSTTCLYRNTEILGFAKEASWTVYHKSSRMENLYHTPYKLNANTWKLNQLTSSSNPIKTQQLSKSKSYFSVNMVSSTG